MLRSESESVERVTYSIALDEVYVCNQYSVNILSGIDIYEAFHQKNKEITKEKNEKQEKKRKEKKKIKKKIKKKEERRKKIKRKSKRKKKKKRKEE